MWVRMSPILVFFLGAFEVNKIRRKLSLCLRCRSTNSDLICKRSSHHENNYSDAGSDPLVAQGAGERGLADPRHRVPLQEGRARRELRSGSLLLVLEASAVPVVRQRRALPFPVFQERHSCSPKKHIFQRLIDFPMACDVLLDRYGSLVLPTDAQKRVIKPMGP